MKKWTCEPSTKSCKQIEFAIWFARKSFTFAAKPEPFTQLMVCESGVTFAAKLLNSECLSRESVCERSSFAPQKHRSQIGNLIRNCELPNFAQKIANKHVSQLKICEIRCERSSFAPQKTRSQFFCIYKNHSRVRTSRFRSQKVANLVSSQKKIVKHKLSHKSFCEHADFAGQKSQNLALSNNSCYYNFPLYKPYNHPLISDALCYL